ncbi:hypothetical protein Golax_014118 [Gossypium laxum]|uniref:Uncharacterized protein n=1 Tax=Gossypium laxum TaxID=34288 RepID=A0A7J8ZV69_9ROSI|nr:hypothetical protein [Gossypium laxum]
MVDLHNVGTFHADTRVNTDYLNELEIMLENFLPRAMLKARHNLESRIKTWKKSHKEADQFRHNSFPYYDQLTSIYAKDRATRKNA